MAQHSPDRMRRRRSSCRSHNCDRWPEYSRCSCRRSWNRYRSLHRRRYRLRQQSQHCGSCDPPEPLRCTGTRSGFPPDGCRWKYRQRCSSRTSPSSPLRCCSGHRSCKSGYIPPYRSTTGNRYRRCCHRSGSCYPRDRSYQPPTGLRCCNKHGTGYTGSSGWQRYRDSRSGTSGNTDNR